jgi:hypothetical protein
MFIVAAKAVIVLVNENFVIIVFRLNEFSDLNFEVIARKDYNEFKLQQLSNQNKSSS